MGTYESVSSAFPSLSVGDDDSFLDGSVDGEVLPKRFICGVVRQSPDEELRPGRVLLLDGTAVGDGSGRRPEDAEASQSSNKTLGIAASANARSRHQHVGQWLTLR